MFKSSLCRKQNKYGDGNRHNKRQRSQQLKPNSSQTCGNSNNFFIKVCFCEEDRHLMFILSRQFPKHKNQTTISQTPSKLTFLYPCLTKRKRQQFSFPKTVLCIARCRKCQLTATALTVESAGLLRRDIFYSFLLLFVLSTVEKYIGDTFLCQKQFSDNWKG